LAAGSFRLPGECRVTLRWLLLIGLTVLITVPMALGGVPAALFLGPMAAAIAFAIAAGPLRVSNTLLVPAYGLLGCMIAKMLPAHGVSAATDWPVMAAGVVFVVAASGVIGWMVTRWRLLPGPTAIWGLSPGSATAMTIMSEDYGADSRLVAIMQYGRLILIAVCASAMAHTMGAGTGPGAASGPALADWFLPHDWTDFALSLALAVAAPIVGERLRLPAGGFLVPTIAGIAAIQTGMLTLDIPRGLLAAGYAVIAWRIGLRFTRPLLAYALRRLPVLLAAVGALLAVSAAMGAAMSLTLGIDPLTAYLATSPGGVDTAAIVAASTRVDLPFVMTMQMLRLIVVLVVGPLMARAMTRWAAGAEPQPEG
jgi:uncharacterized protein